jgi:hypothetical protein
MDTATADKIINAVPTGWHMVCVTVPTRALRVIRDDLSLKFRVEQLDATNWSWRVVSTHTGDEAWESIGPSIQDAITKQARLKEKIKLALHEKRMAMIKAENPLNV